MRVRRSFALLLAVILGIGMLCGCNTPAGSESPASSGTEPESEERLPLSDGFGLPYVQELYFDPLTTESSLNVYLAPLIFQSLYVIGTDMTAAPQLAKESDLSGATLRITLRGDVVFHNGTVLTAEDVVYSFKRIQGNTESPYFDDLLNVTDCCAEGSGTVVFTLAETTADWRTSLTFPVVRRDTGKSSDAVGSGPYALRTSEGVRYLSAVGGDSRPQDLPFSRIDLIPVKDLDDMVKAFEKGNIDCMAVDTLSVRSFMPVCSYSVQSAPAGIGNILLFNAKRGLLADPAVRNALSALLPRRDICAQALSGAADPSSDWIAGGLVKNVSEMERETAIENLAAAGMIAAEETKGVTLRLLYCDDLWQRTEEAREIVSWFSELGIGCELVGKSYEDYTAARESGDFDLCLYRRRLRSPSDLAALIFADGSDNVTGYVNAEAEAELTVLLQASEDTADEAAAEVSRLISSDTPFAVIGYENIRVYFRDGMIRNFNPRPDSPYGNPAEWEISE
ncbi:MAG: ABC transporter substrate-binding protein [Clostridia bacterium]|nr:ABC transporter substrate-binding protein [Clostridia bacterium]